MKTPLGNKRLSRLSEFGAHFALHIKCIWLFAQILLIFSIYLTLFFLFSSAECPNPTVPAPGRCSGVPMPDHRRRRTIPIPIFRWAPIRRCPVACHCSTVPVRRRAAATTIEWWWTTIICRIFIICRATRTIIGPLDSARFVSIRIRREYRVIMIGFILKI